MIDVTDAQLLAVLEYLTECSHMVIVRMGDEPGFHLATHGSQEPSQEHTLGRHASVHHYQTPPMRTEHIRVAYGIGMRRDLPHGETGTALEFHSRPLHRSF